MQALKNLFLYSILSLTILTISPMLHAGTYDLMKSVPDDSAMTAYKSEVIEQASLTRIESKSRDAAVKVVTQSGYGSGSYVTMFNRDTIFFDGSLWMYKCHKESHINIELNTFKMFSTIFVTRLLCFCQSNILGLSLKQVHKFLIP